MTSWCCRRARWSSTGNPAARSRSSRSTPAGSSRARGTQFEIAIGDPPAPAAAGAATQIRQGMLEEANVEVARVATNMLANQRMFGANQTVFSTSDETLAQAVRDVGRVG